MTMPDDEAARPTFEIRATFADGARFAVGPFASLTEASERARAVLGQAGCRRVETLRRTGERVELLGVSGWPTPVSGRRADGDGDDRLRPRHIDGGIVGQ